MIPHTRIRLPRAGAELGATRLGEQKIAEGFLGAMNPEENTQRIEPLGGSDTCLIFTLLGVLNPEFKKKHLVQAKAFCRSEYVWEDESNQPWPPSWAALHWLGCQTLYVDLQVEEMGQPRHPYPSSLSAIVNNCKWPAAVNGTVWLWMGGLVQFDESFTQEKFHEFTNNIQRQATVPISIVPIKSAPSLMVSYSLLYPFRLRCGEREKDLDGQPFPHSVPNQYNVLLQLF